MNRRLDLQQKKIDQQCRCEGGNGVRWLGSSRVRDSVNLAHRQTHHRLLNYPIRSGATPTTIPVYLHAYVYHIITLWIPIVPLTVLVFASDEKAHEDQQRPIFLLAEPLSPGDAESDQACQEGAEPRRRFGLYDVRVLPVNFPTLRRRRQWVRKRSCWGHRGEAGCHQLYLPEQTDEDRVGEEWDITKQGADRRPRYDTLWDPERLCGALDGRPTGSSMKTKHERVGRTTTLFK